MVGLFRLTPEEMEAINLLSEHPAFELYVGVINRLRDEYLDNFARGLAMNPNPINQREVDEKRGYFKCANFLTVALPTYASKKWKRFVEEATKESG